MYICNYLVPSRVYRRQVSTAATTLRVEIRDNPVYNLSANSTNQTSQIQNILSTICNTYQSGELQTTWLASSATGNTAPVSLGVQEPLNQTTVALSVIDHIALVVPPELCREQSPCAIQPVIVAYDSNGAVIQKLGTINQPWQIVASIVGQSNVTVLNPIANYSNGQTQYTTFGFSNLGTYQVLFTFIAPNGVST